MKHALAFYFFLKKILFTLSAFLLLFLLTSTVSAQGLYHYENVLNNQKGVSVTTAAVWICVSGIPIVETVTKSSASLTITIAALTTTGASFPSYDCILGHN